MLRRYLSFALILLLAATPIAAYTIYLKDGSRLIAREKYTLEGDRALILLQNGTQTFLAASEIDVPRTDAANRNNYGTAMVLQDGEFTEAPPDPSPSARSPSPRSPGAASARTPKRSPSLPRLPRRGALQPLTERRRRFSRLLCSSATASWARWCCKAPCDAVFRWRTSKRWR